MGALTNNRKRGDDYYNSPFPVDQSSIHKIKRPRFSVSPPQSTPESSRPQSSNSIISKISQYPERKLGFSREVHAPIRNSRFGLFSSAKKRENTASSKESPEMGGFRVFSQLLRNQFVRRYQKAKEAAIGSFCYATVRKEKEKEVIEIDSEDDNQDDVADDSSIEEVEAMVFVGSKRKTRQKNDENPLKLNVLETVEKEVRSLDSSVVTDTSDAIAKVDGGNNNVSMQLDQGAENSDLPVYKKLLNYARKRNCKLDRLKFDIGTHEKRIQRSGMLRPRKKEEQIKKDVAKECFVPLTEEEESEVSCALSISNRRKVLVSHEKSNIDITVEKLQCLKPQAWLNDEVINLYLELLKEREKREPGKFLKCHFFNTFFYKKLIGGRGGYNFQSVRRWTTQRKLGYNLLECDKIFVPIHKEVHWCLAIINNKEEKFQYLDSLRGFDYQVLDVLAKYFVDEVKDKCGEDINAGSWVQELVTELPEQENGFDCGVFMIKYADFYSRDVGLCFRQKHMPYFRRRTAKEILKLRAD
ncbi:hypothetical protein OROHE_016687 [Orobanche hederae]